MARKLVYYVHLDDDKGAPHVFGPDDTVPGWAQKLITNPSAWAGEGDEVDADEDGDDGDQVVPYKKRLKADLEDEVASRNEGREDDDLIVVGGTGKVSDLAAALEADDAKNADQA